MAEGSIVFELTIPSIWPPESDLVLLAGLYDENDITLISSPTSKFLINVTNKNSRHSFTSQPLLLPNYPRVKMAISWGENEGITCAINGIIISSGKEVLEVEARSVPPGRRKSISFPVNHNLKIEEALFINTIQEMQNRVLMGDSYNLLMTSGLLRKLLLDASSLIHLINRYYKMKLTFPVVREREIPKVSCESTFEMRNVYTDNFSEEEIDLLQIDKFLKTSVLKDDKYDYTVRDVILLCANKRGGIHLDSYTKDDEQRLIELSVRFNPLYMDSCFIVLADIAWSVLQGLRPLIAEIYRIRG